MKTLAHCRWCSRNDVPLTKKGGLANHVDAGGRKCVAVGMKVGTDARTTPRPWKGTTNRNAKRRNAWYDR